MNLKGHAKWYFISMIPLTIFILGYWICYWRDIIWFEFMPLQWWHLFAFYFAFFLINPDYDLLFGVNDHRSFISHSILYPTITYWIFHDFWNMENAKVLGLIIYFPVLIHLLCDYKIGDKGEGSWRISWNFLSIKIGNKRYPIRHKRMSKIMSIIWVILNIIGIILYILWLWQIIII